MIEQLAKRHKEWVSIAYYFCKNKYDAEDLIQDMYLKLHNNNTINSNSIFFVIKNMYIDAYRKNIKLPTKVELTENISTFDEYEYDYELDAAKELTLIKINELPYFEKELLTVTQEISQRKLSRETEIPFVVINQNIKKTKNKIWEQVKKTI